MFCAMEFRQLVLEAPARPPGGYVVLKDGRVFDASLTLWDQGVDWGMDARELRWRAPAALVCGWDPRAAETAATRLARILKTWGGGLQVLDARRAVVEWPHPLPTDWQALVRMTVPAYAGRVHGGLAPHPLLARWVVRAGAALRLPLWEAEGCPLWVCEASEAARVWQSLPLTAAPVTEAEMRRWRRAGARRVGDVPGLAVRLNRLGLGGLDAMPEIYVERRWAEALTVGTGAMLAELARALAGRLAAFGLAARGLGLQWDPEQGAPVERERMWTYATQSAATLALRAVGVAEPWPEVPPVRLRLAALALEPAEPEQLAWWGTLPERSRRAEPDPFRPVTVSPREERLGFWDPWRQGGMKGAPTAR
jgi:hypothetical protein